MTMCLSAPMFSTKCLLLPCLLLCFGFLARAQTPALGPDSSTVYLRLLEDLAKNGNFESAEIEGQHLRSWLDRSGRPCPPAAVPLLSGIYRANKDTRSAYQFFGEAEMDARYDRNPSSKIELLGALVTVFEDWDDPARALSNQKLLGAVRDSLNANRIEWEKMQFAQMRDSLQNDATLSQTQDSFSLERSHALALAIILATILLTLLINNYRTAARWRKKLLHKDIEMDLLRANLHPTNTIPPFVAEAQAREEQISNTRNHYPHGEAPEQIALVIEPNRQVALYLKSILSDQFQVELAATANEGLQAAERILPDLIVCDAVLNGKTGIELARQIKLSEKTNHIPVVLLSDHFGNDAKLDALRAGADMWFSRPVIDTEFNKSVQQLLTTRKAQYEQFGRLLHLYFTEARPAISNAFLQNTVALIEAHLSDKDFMADDLARKLQLPKPLFSKKLKMLTGKEPVQLIREMRLEKAKVLLEKRAGQPQTVAELVGFSNPGSFAMAFKDYFGENTLLLK